jgi:integrase
MRKALTDTFLRALKEPAITQAGNRSWSYRYRAPVTGKLSRATIGPYPTISLADARLRADELRKGVAGGENPSETKRRAKREAPGRTFKALSDRYVAEYARRTKKSAWRDERNLVLHVLPKWEDLDYAAIRRRDVIELIEGIISHGTPVLANRIQSLVSGIFSFAVDADLLDANPCTRLKKRGEEHAGDRVLTDPEIRLFWNMVVEAPASYETGQGLRLALLTGVRIGEVAGIVPAEFEWLDDAAKAVWSIPGSRTKNRLTHVVPLAPMALEIAREIAPIAPGSYAAAMKRIAERLPGQGPAERTWRDDPPTPHDLRRTFRTRLPQMGVPADIRDRLMNHIPTDVGSKHYDRYQYLNEKRAALDLWAQTLSDIISAGGS